MLEFSFLYKLDFNIVHKVAILVKSSGEWRQSEIQRMVEKKTKGDYWHAIHAAHNPLVVDSVPAGPTISIFT